MTKHKSEEEIKRRKFKHSLHWKTKIAPKSVKLKDIKVTDFSKGDIKFSHQKTWNIKKYDAYPWDQLKEHIKKYGLLEKINLKVIDHKTYKYQAINGNHRITVLLDLYGEDYVLSPDKIAIYKNKNIKKWGEYEDCCPEKKNPLVKILDEKEKGYKSKIIRFIKKLILFIFKIRSSKYKIKRIKQAINFSIMRWYLRMILKFNVKLKEIPLYDIFTQVRFDLSDKLYDWDKLYKSLLKTNGLDLKNHTPPLVYPLIWKGKNEAIKTALEKGFIYRAKEGNHRIATLKFINLNEKVKPLTPPVMIKVLVINEDFYNKLDRYELLSNNDPAKYQKADYIVKHGMGKIESFNKQDRRLINRFKHFYKYLTKDNNNKKL